MPEQEYLVFYEDTTPEEQLVLDIHTVRSAFASSLDIEADLGLNVNNVAGTTGRWGISLASLGLLLSVISALLFSLNYPDNWTPASGNNTQLLVNLMSVIGMIALVIGTALTVVGRRIDAQGILHGIHLVERRPGPVKKPLQAEVDPLAEESWDAEASSAAPEDWKVDDISDAEDDDWDFGAVTEPASPPTPEEVGADDDDPFADEEDEDPFASKD